jgi:hypothetical protein
MRVQNVHPLFTSFTSTFVSRHRAKTLTKLVGGTVLAGDELRAYTDAKGHVAQVLLVHREGTGAIQFSPGGEFLWGTLIEAAGHEFLIGDCDPYVVVRLSDLGYYTSPLH